jgi:hypothetical protein
MPSCSGQRRAVGIVQRIVDPPQFVHERLGVVITGEIVDGMPKLVS